MGWLEPENILSGINIIIMGIFTFLVWRATKNGADAAKSSYELNKRLFEVEVKEAETTRKLFIDKLISDLVEINIFLETYANRLDSEAISRLPRHHGLNEIQLAKHFSKSEINDILLTWHNFETYLQNHWLNEDGTLITSFSVKEIELINENTTFVVDSIKEGISKLYELREVI